MKLARIIEGLDIINVSGDPYGDVSRCMFFCG